MSDVDDVKRRIEDLEGKNKGSGCGCVLFAVIILAMLLNPTATNRIANEIDSFLASLTHIRQIERDVKALKERETVRAKGD